jgi:hypothetical protein
MRLRTPLVIAIILLSLNSQALNKISDRATRIAIIGAGAAGLNTAALLKHNGYQNIKVFEKSRAHNYGKVRTQKIDNAVVETGPIQVGIGHIYTNFWLNKFGLETFEPHPAYILRHGIKEHSHRLLTPTEEFLPMGKRLEIFEEALRFKEIIAAFKRKYPDISTIPTGSDYNLSFYEFCLRNKLRYFHHMYSIYTSAYGYGITKEIPTFSVLNVFDDNLGLAAWLYFGMNLKMIKKGFSALLEAFITNYNLDQNILYEQKINQIIRDNTGINIISNNKNYYFDTLIIACPIDNIFNILDKKSKEEEELYNNLYYSPYHVLVAEIPDLPRGGFVLPEKFNNHREVQMLSKNSLDGDQVVMYLPQISSIKAKDIDSTKMPDLGVSMYSAKKSLEELGFHMGVMYDAKAWNNYNPHFLEPRFYGYESLMQGNNNTFWVGTMFSTIDYVNEAFAHAHRVTDKYFDGDFMIQEQSLNTISQWHFNAKDLYSDEQKAATPGLWSLTFNNWFRSF